MNERLACPLCEASVDDELFHRDERRDYYHCGICDLVFVPAWQLPDVDTEKAIYDQHQNNPLDAGYRSFLHRLTDPLLKQLAKPAMGLDFGCGPGPTVSLLMQEAGYEMQIYDPIYAPEQSVLEQKYDFITSTEVFEHLHEPGRVIHMLAGILQPAGWLGVMTKRIPEDKPFAEWHYTRDPTHVTFFAETSFDWIAKEFGFRREFISNDIVLLQKQQWP